MSNLATITNNILADSGIDDINVVVTTGSYANPAWITSLAWTKITGAPLGDYLPLAGGVMTGQIVLKEGTNSTDFSKGLRFPNDPYGGSGDTSGLRLYAETTTGAEAQVLELYCQNDIEGVSQDRINFSAPNNNLVTVNGNRVWNAGNLTNPVTGTGSAGQVAYWSSGSAITGESNLFWDATNDRLGIGIAGPALPLDLYNASATGLARFRANNVNGAAITIKNDQGTNDFSIYSTGYIAFGVSGWANNAVLESATGIVYSAYNGSHLFQSGVNGRSPRMIINSDGNVGIGTNSITTYSLSGTHLEVFGGANYSFIHNNTNTVKSFFATNEIGLLAALFTFSAHPLTFGTNNTERMRIWNSSGNVNIGPTPSSDAGFKLDVNGTGRFSGRLNSTTLYVNSTEYTFANFTSAVIGPRPAADGIANLWLRPSDASNNVGFSLAATSSVFTIGSLVTGPFLSMAISGGAATFSSSVTSNTNGFVAINGYGLTSYPSSSSTGANIVFSSSIYGGIDGIYQSSGNTSDFAIWTNGGSSTQPKLMIKNGGNVGIGTATPSSGKLVVSDTASNKLTITGGSSQNGMTWEATGGANSFYLFNGTISSAGWGVYNVNTAAFPLFITNGTNVIIGTTSDNGAKFQVNGNISAGNISAVTNTIGTVDMGLSGGGYATLGYNIQYTSSANTYQYKVGDTSWMADFGNANLFRIRYAPSGTAGNTISYSNLLTLNTSGAATFSNLAGSGNRIVVANSGGTLISAVIGSGLAFDGTTLTATGGSSGSISGSGTSGTIALFTGTSSIGNSVITQSGSNVTVNGEIRLIGPNILRFEGAGPNNAFISESWGINLNGANTHPIQVRNASLSVGYALGGGVGYGTDNLFVLGNVGINTTSPSGKLGIQVANSGSNVSGLDVTNAVNASFNVSLRTDVTTITAGGTGNMVFANSTERMRITSGGNVLIGTTDNAGNFRNIISNSTGGQAFIGITNQTGASGNRALRIGFSSGDTVAQIQGTSINVADDINIALQPGGGKVFIGTTSDNGSTLRVNGSIFADGNIRSVTSIFAASFFEVSDATIKTLVQDNYQAKGIESVVAKLYIKNGKQELGYFAQDLENILPSAVNKGTDGLLNLSYREVHTAKIAALEKRIKELESQLKNN